MRVRLKDYSVWEVKPNTLIRFAYGKVTWISALSNIPITYLVTLLDSIED